MRPVVLIVDDDPGVCYTLAEILGGSDLDLLQAADGQEALALLGARPVDLVITDLRMPRVDGMELLRRARALARPPSVIMITAHGSERQAVEAMRLGAIDYFAKPFDADAVQAVVERAVASLRQAEENEQLRAELLLSRHLVFASPAMRRLALVLHRAAGRDITVLITGPSGTGKERVAEALVAGSRRAGGPFVRFNCAALPDDLAEAELFGHARGAFTGADRARPGIFREADGGTVLLDEVGELSLATQGKLLRVLQDGLVRPVGEAREARVDVRVMAATNRDLSAEVAARRFREDLYYRLNVVELQIPPLSRRAEDVPVLIDHFVRRFAERYGVGALRLAPGLMTRLCAADYPGNVRELMHRIEALVALAPPGAEVLDETPDGAAPDARGPLGLRERVDAFERRLVIEALAQCRGNRSEAARRLLVSRVTLLEKIRKYGLE